MSAMPVDIRKGKAFALNKEELDRLRKQYHQHVIRGKNPDDCWRWSGDENGGYGRLNITKDGKAYRPYAHRFSYYLHKGNTGLEGMDVLHSCHNPECTNPLHLSLGTNTQNIADKVARRANHILPAKAKAILETRLAKHLQDEQNYIAYTHHLVNSNYEFY